MGARVSEFANQSELISTVMEALQMLERVGSNISEVGKAVSEADRELCDIYHYIEFNDLNVVGGYKAYKMLQDILRRRRLAKDEYALVQSVHDNRKQLNKIQAVLDRQRTYIPRVYDGLFEKEETE